MDNLANALVNIKNCEEMGKKECTIRPASKLVGSVLKIMQREGYVGDFELIEDGRSGMYRVQLKGAVNNCKAIKPRYSTKKDEFPKWEKRYLPSKTLGTLIVSTPNGVISHREAKMAGVGGKLIAFIY